MFFIQNIQDDVKDVYKDNILVALFCHILLSMMNYSLRAMGIRVTETAFKFRYKECSTIDSQQDMDIVKLASRISVSSDSVKSKSPSIAGDEETEEMDMTSTMEGEIFANVYVPMDKNWLEIAEVSIFSTLNTELYILINKLHSALIAGTTHMDLNYVLTNVGTNLKFLKELSESRTYSSVLTFLKR